MRIPSEDGPNASSNESRDTDAAYKLAREINYYFREVGALVLHIFLAPLH